MPNRLAWIRSLSAAALALFITQACAQEWPNKPVRFIVPFGPGGVVDSVFSAIRPTLETRLKQPVHMEHKAGGGGLVGMQAVAISAPDGHTFGIVPSNTMVINQFLFKLPIDPLTDFAPVSVLIDVPLLLAISARHPARSVDEFFADLRARPGVLNYGSPGLGTPPHLAAELIVRHAGLSAVHVPYKGGHAAAFALAANEIQFMVIAHASLSAQIAAGSVRPIAVAARERLTSLPDVPTLGQAGHSELQKVVPRSWWAVIAPKGTPADIVARIADDLRQALNEPEAQRRLKAVGLEPVGSTPAQFAAQLPEEAKRWSELIRTAGITAQ